MPKLPASRILISLALLLVFFVFLVAVLFITNLSFSVWEQLQKKPEWFIWSYILAIVLIAILFGRIIWRFLLPKKTGSVKEKQSRADTDNIQATAQRLEDVSRKLAQDGQKEKPADNADSASKAAEEVDDLLLNKWADEFESSAELASIKKELKDYTQRKSQETLYIALFGDISSGKSSVIKALITSSDQQEKKAEEEKLLIETSVLGGTTREIKHYHWHIENDGIEQHYILTDMPGLNEQFAELDLLAIEEVQRAHIAIYLCDGDLTASQFNELKTLFLLQKPCILALNKADRYSQKELQLIIKRIRQRLIDFSPAFNQAIPVISINAGGLRDYIRLTPDGEEERVQRTIPPDVTLLQEQLVKMMQTYGIDRLGQLREKSVAQMVNNKLDDIEARFKHSQSRRMVSSYTKKAVVASIATISPGTDLLVQGYLGIQMIKDLCKLYEVSATDIDANKLIELIQSRMDKTLPLLLAIAGNGLKAFPGIGTVSGGLMHAVAYGMIFDTLGHSVARTLEVTGELSPVLISDLYKEQLGENIESRTKDFIKLVLKLRKSDG